MNDVANDIAWQVAIRNDDMHSMSNEAKTEFISELSKAIQSICWAYGVHN
jgi:hypothetical protein